MTRASRFSPLLLATAYSVGAAQAEDGVAAMCAELAPPEACACASEALLAEIGTEDFQLYDAIGADYVERMARGEERAAAWDAASATVAAGAGITPRELLPRTNKIGRTHRAHIVACANS